MYQLNSLQFLTPWWSWPEHHCPKHLCSFNDRNTVHQSTPVLDFSFEFLVSNLNTFQHCRTITEVERSMTYIHK